MNMDSFTDAFSLQGRVALVTGAAGGLGLETARWLSAHGAVVVISDVRSEVAAAAQQLRGEGLDVHSRVLDVANADAVFATVESVRAEIGSIDILVNNAGLKHNHGTAAKMEPSAWDREIAINLSGAFYCARATLPGMIERSWGRIIGVSSFVALSGLHGAPGYAASKSGLNGLTRTIALEAYRYGVTANVVCPGPIAVPGASSDPKIAERFLSRLPGGKFGEAQDVAAAITYLASDAAKFVNGIELPIDAGARLFYTGNAPKRG
ncbi:SDR family oxidoreductase [Arthrobacter sp. ISL-85]|uniref:SDR family NAD(P)-dependent oxidoreductase n=1 Tax=Arthrobacter sp. ISL-85 TaxID=2819115 RepID=UPI001BE5E312|nr:SDR family NAD(P)-dependent oxidoreductase [Arthrobacter sp. ISL-85]MBT2568517.1 SDR family oxidoreductase [Arthrobacter sp. ISL-85]